MRTLAVALIAALSLVAGACGGTASSNDKALQRTSSTTALSSQSSDVCTPEKAGGTVTFGEFIAPTSLDPANVVGAQGLLGGTEMMAIYDALMRYDSQTGRFEPWIAKSVTSNGDDSEWTVTLRSAVTFGNGDPLTAQAVKDSVLRLRDPNLHSAKASLMEDIADIETPNASTVIFKLKAPWGTFPSFLASEAGMIVNTKVVAQLGSAFSTMPKGAGVGPYEPVSLAPNEQIVLQAKTNYWGGPVCISQLRFIRYSGAPATYEALKTGAINAGFLREARTIAQAKHDKAQLFITPNNAGGMLFINNRPAYPGADARIRQAIAYAIDPNVVDQRANNGLGHPTSALIGPTSRWYQGLNGLPYDPTKAKQLLQQVVAEGAYHGALNFICPSDPFAQQTALTIESQLTAVGFTINLKLMTTITQAMNQGNFDIACNTANIADDAPDLGLLQFTSAGSVRTMFKNPQFDAAVEALKQAPDETTTKASLKNIQSLWNQLVPSAVYSVVDEAIVSSPRIRGLGFTRTTIATFDRAYISS